MYKSLIFLITLIAGLASTMLPANISAVFENGPKFTQGRAEPEVGCDVKSNRLETSLLTRGVERIGNDKRVDFVFSNKGCEAIRYWGYTADSPTFRIKSDGKEIEQFYCGTGLQEFELAAGNSVVFSLPTEAVSYADESADVYAIGWSISNKKGTAMVWSNEFSIPDRKLKKESPELRNQK